MFFIMGINTGRKHLPFHQAMVCSRCGKYSSCSVYMTYTVLSLFFIPCFRWNRKYYVTMNCCHTTYQLDSETGKRILRGEPPEISPGNLTPVNEYGSHYDALDTNYNKAEKECRHCGFRTDEDYEYCPKCGTPFTN